ncbi:hypothetical protein C1N53_09120 [Pontibacter sp. SGAir0037]|nr:hypothetical protein C1N53_09120 [Pontibacter sp. SGAir0037]
MQPEHVNIHHEVVHDTATELVLHNGERWQVDETTIHSMRLLQAILQEHAFFYENRTPEAYQVLGQILQEEMQQVNTHCTLKGEAHDMLHVYLKPFEEDAKLLNGNSLATASTAYERMNDHIQLFDTYFK